MSVPYESRPQVHARVGAILHGAARYDFLVWLATLGRDSRFRNQVLELSGAASGETVLDVACGTGNLALDLKRATGPTGTVHGVDASSEMISRAGRKAAKRCLDVRFSQALAQELPYEDAYFDVTLSTRAFHHLPSGGRESCAREMHRVLKPGGRLLIVDFDRSRRTRGLLIRFHRHGGVKTEEILKLVAQTGFTCMESGALGNGRLTFVRARK